jgi:hypothetical protein
MLPLRKRSLGFIVFLFVILAASHYCFSYPFDPFLHDLEERPAEATSQNDDMILPHNSMEKHSLCEPDECTRGSWFPRQPPFQSIADFRKEYPKTPFTAFKICGSEENKRGEEDRVAFHQAQEERLVLTMNWVWKPVNGHMRDWNAIEFVIRLLRSPGGLIFSGGAFLKKLVLFVTQDLV